MRTVMLVLAFVALVPGGLAQDEPSASDSEKDFVVICHVNGMIDDGVSVFVKRALREARTAKALILVVDTPGGKVDSAIEISNALMDAPCKTVAYIEGMGAISAGALISYSCDLMLMAPGSAMGAATPVLMGPEGIEPTGEKEVSFMRAKMRALAERNGHNPAIAQAMVDKDLGLRSILKEGKLVIFNARQVKDADEASTSKTDQTLEVILDILKELVGPLPLEKIPKPAEHAPATPPAPDAHPDDSQEVLPVGKLLTLTPNEAVQYGVIPTTANSLDEVMGFLELPTAKRVTLEMTWAEEVFRFLTSPLIAGLLLMLGIGGVYMEMKTPGFGLPGIIGLVCLALFFGAYGIIGLAEWIDVLLVAAGVSLILVEMFLIPGVGFVGAAGLVCIVLGVYLALTSVVFPEFSWQYDRLWNAAQSAVVASVTLTLLVYLTWKYLPKTPVYGTLIQSHSQQQALGYVVQTGAQSEAAVGLAGTAVSKLRPAGRGRFGDTTFDVVSRGEYIEAGTPIIIVQADGNRYVVDKAEGVN